MTKRLFNWILLSLMSITISSCAGVSEEMDLLDKSTKSYERAIRWGEFTRAKSFHKKSPKLHDIERRRLKFYRITSYKIIQIDTPNKFNSHVLLEIKYYKNDRPIVKSILAKQHWRREEDSKTWYLDSPFPNFR